MALIKSISGIRGTIGGNVGDNLTPIDAVKFAAAYGTWIKTRVSKENYKIVIGRDARISGEMISSLVTNTLIGLGIHVIDVKLSTTPTVEVMVPHLNADGGIILTASHNPIQWNALKLFNNKGEFLSAEDGQRILELVDSEDFDFSPVLELGDYSVYDGDMELHVERILELPLVEVDLIKNEKLKVVVDPVNSTGSIILKELLEKLNVEVLMINDEPNGHFAHNPEPRPEHLTELSARVVKEKAAMGITVDPDVDRLAFVCENGEMFGEEYTLVAVADYVLSNKKGAAVSNLSSSRALRDVCAKHGVDYYAAAVGEVNVVKKMKEVNAVIGGEGNGGIISPDLHYGRDAVLGLAYFLSHFVLRKLKMSELKKSYPEYFIVKEKLELNPSVDVNQLLEKFEAHHKNEEVSTIDGVKVDFSDGWVHLRKSNTEPIIRVIAESKDENSAKEICKNSMDLINSWS